MEEDEYSRREFISAGFYDDEKGTVDNDKMRSLFLGALTTFSVFAGTVALSGSAYDSENEQPNTTYNTSTELNQTGDEVLTENNTDLNETESYLEPHQ